MWKEFKIKWCNENKRIQMKIFSMTFRKFYKVVTQ